MDSVSSDVHSTLPDLIVDGGFSGMLTTNLAVLFSAGSSGSSYGSTVDLVSKRYRTRSMTRFTWGWELTKPCKTRLDFLSATMRFFSELYSTFNVHCKNLVDLLSLGDRETERLPPLSPLSISLLGRRSATGCDLGENQPWEWIDIDRRNRATCGDSFLAPSLWRSQQPSHNKTHLDLNCPLQMHYAISPRLLCYATVILAFHHCTGSQQSASRGRVLAFYRIAPCLRSYHGYAEDNVLELIFYLRISGYS